MSSTSKAVARLDASFSNFSINDTEIATVTGSLASGRRLRPLCCANQNISMDRSCTNEAALTCSGCYLVRYCSKECQTAHWKSHKKDCKHPMNSKSWYPAWVREDRKPAFLIGGGMTGLETKQRFGKGMGLWGNMTAIDVINAENNEGIEGIRNKDLSLAFIACGDLRNVVKTINGLPDDYSGTIKIVLNDVNPMAVCRNLIILSILGIIKDVEEAAEHALHVWYSIFLPVSFQTHVTPLLARASSLEHLDGTPARLTSTTTTYTKWKLDSIRLLFIQLSKKDLDYAAAKEELNSTMNAPERIDYRERQYASLRPSHRVALDAWRRSGMLLPFGTINDCMSVPNRWLFSPVGDLLLNDGSSGPLDGWDYDEAIKAGRAHGTTDDDLMGGLFFYVKSQLVEFSERLRRFKVHIYSYDHDARDLPRILKSDPSSPQTFDRIEVSNIVDKNYVGMSLLSDWGPFLNKDNPHAAVVGHFMNWTTWKKSGEVGSSMAPPGAVTRAQEAMKACKHVDKPDRFSFSKHHPKLLKIATCLEIFYDTYGPFQEYFKQEKAETIARKGGLKCRRINKIVPHRCFTKLGTSPNSLPYIDSSDRWYRVALLSNSTYCERYVEWTRVGSDV
ncbi:hypothetical protein IW261DRAFT_1469714 [Armillaria novae-zelandiae]|uniref:MYND-type domain-containing protein n=1 Tax=Armillaria novae-zelandiae TaxID=153914 RepID=A0AA39PEJ9_9AGAR|nr:hypothetical protein IW261DRAFT_1469714 [Armillaria novae-zelandiae]